MAMEQKEVVRNKFVQWWKRMCPYWLGGGLTDQQQQLRYNLFERFFLKLFIYGTLENYVAKSVIGFIGGVCLTYLFFAIFILQLNFSFASATLICSIFGMVFTLGLAYSSTVRCIVLMLLPQFFSKRGRHALTAYAFILVLTGPARNTLHNMRILSETLACGQNKLKKSMKAVIDLVKEPVQAVKNAIEQIIKQIKVVVSKVKEMVSALKRTIISVLGVLKSAFDWLNNSIAICSKKLGTPFQRCSRMFDEAVIDCKAKLGPLFNWLCSIAYMISSVCYAVKFLDYICELVEFVSDEIIFRVKKKFREFSYQVRNIFYVSVDFSHSFELETNQSKSLRDITGGIALEIRQKTAGILTFFDWMSFVFGFFFLYMIFQTIHYKRKFLTQDWFDNRFITTDLIMLDLKRTYLGKETILPLNIHERKKYISLTSWRLLASEKRRLAKTAIFLVIASTKLSIHMIADYSLFWVLNMIRFHAQFQSHVDAPSNVEVRVNGSGLISEMFTSIINAFQPSGLKYDMDTVPCLPDPRPPDTGVYKQIVSLAVLTWILAVIEPYGLRLRHYILSYYYPIAAKQRAVWLYNHILRSRGSFLKYIRRQLRRRFSKSARGVEKIPLKDRLMAVCPILLRIFPGSKTEFCLLCGVPGTVDKPLVYCSTPNCVGKFCENCYATLNNVCTICKNPIEYGDLSDYDEEVDSSDTSIPSPQISETHRKSSKKIKNEDEDTEALAKLLEEESDSDLSYEYQTKERPPGDRPPFEPPYEVEEQKTFEGVTLDSFELPVDELPEDYDPEPYSLRKVKSSGLVRGVSQLMFPHDLTSERITQNSEFKKDVEKQTNQLKQTKIKIEPTAKINKIMAKPLDKLSVVLEKENTVMPSMVKQQNNTVMPSMVKQQNNTVMPLVVKEEDRQKLASNNLEEIKQFKTNKIPFLAELKRKIMNRKQSITVDDVETVELEPVKQNSFDSRKSSKHELELKSDEINKNESEENLLTPVLPEKIESIVLKKIDSKDKKPVELDGGKVETWLQSDRFQEQVIETVIETTPGIHLEPVDVKIRDVKKSRNVPKTFRIFNVLRKFWAFITNRRTTYKILPKDEHSTVDSEESIGDSSEIEETDGIHEGVYSTERSSNREFGSTEQDISSVEETTNEDVIRTSTSTQSSTNTNSRMQKKAMINSPSTPSSASEESSPPSSRRKYSYRRLPSFRTLIPKETKTQQVYELFK